MSRAVGNATADLTFVKAGDAQFRKGIPPENMGQIVRQMVLLRINYNLYNSFSETVLFLCNFSYAPENFLDSIHDCLLLSAGPSVAWAHAATPMIPSFVDSCRKKVVNNKFAFWKLTNDFVKDRNAFVPLKLMKHEIQSIYSKTKGDVNGSALARQF